MMNALFTDLDGTLIFSQRSLPAHLTLEKCSIMETYTNGQYGYMESQTQRYLAHWSTKNLFVPVTTRSIDQYQRLLSGFKDFHLPYFLVSNGGNLYRDGVLDHHWNKEVRKSLAVELEHTDEALAVVQGSLLPEWIRKIKIIDELYFCILVIEREWEIDKIATVNQLLRPLGWQAYFQKKKLYVLPIALSKENAVNRLKDGWKMNRQQIEKHYGLGDTTMDIPMLEEQNAYLYFGNDSRDFPHIVETNYSFSAIAKLLD